MIETERLILRKPILNDFEPFAKMRSNFERSKFAGGGLDKPQAWSRFSSWVGSWELFNFGMFSLIDKNTNEWLGNIGPVSMYEWIGQEFGWALIESAEGKGIATEAAKAALKWSANNLEFNEYTHSIHPDNITSIKLAQRLGAEFIGNVPLPPPLESEPNILYKSYKKDWL